MKYCNIVTETELFNHVENESINYYKYNINYNKIDNKLPTLYVGWLFLKKCNIYNVDILKNSIIENKLYWIPSFEENKTLHINGVKSFVSLAPTLFFKNTYNYMDVDPVICGLYTISDILECIGESFDKSYQYKNDIIYLLKNNIIFGLNLKMFEFFKFNISELLTILNKTTNNIVLDYNGDIYVENFKKLPNFKYLKRFMVCM